MMGPIKYRRFQTEFDTGKLGFLNSGSTSNLAIKKNLGGHANIL